MENTQEKTTTQTTQEKRTIVEEFKVSGEAVVSKVKELVHEGNVRRITIKNEEGKTLFEIPLVVGVIGALLLPQLAALGAVGALIARLTITIEREEVVAKTETPAETPNV
jgi:DNA-binding Lrp family transcriptional regulator